MLTEGPILGPGTIDDLVADARLLGHPMRARAIRDWQERGLIDEPDRQGGLGQGRGSKKALYSAYQRKVFREVVRKRPQVRKIAALACIPVYLWAYWGDEYASLRQVRLAMRLHLNEFARPSLEGCTKLANQLIDQLADPDASGDARRKALSQLTAAMYHGTTVDAELESALLGIYDPTGEGRLAGPPGVPINIDTITKTAVVREVAIRKLLDPTDPVPDEVFVEARRRMADGLRQYLQTRPALAAEAGEMSGMFAEPSAREIVQDSCSTLTTLVGLAIS